jgi:hypothetical protein
MVGAGLGTVPPPIVMVPAPPKLTLIVVPVNDPDPDKENEPVAPAYPPLPPVIEAGASAIATPERSADSGILIVPVNELLPPVRLMVNVAVRFPLASAITGTVALKLPLPTFVNVAVPVSVTLVLVRENGPLALTVIVEVIVAAFAMAPAKIASAQVFMIAVIVYLLRNTQAGK